MKNLSSINTGYICITINWWNNQQTKITTYNHVVGFQCRIYTYNLDQDIIFNMKYYRESIKEHFIDIKFYKAIRNVQKLYCGLWAAKGKQHQLNCISWWLCQKEIFVSIIILTIWNKIVQCSRVIIIIIIIIARKEGCTLHLTSLTYL